MKFIDLKLKFKDHQILDTRNIINVFGAFDRRRFFEWQQKRYIKKITSNFYIFADLQIDDTVLKVIANKIYSPSYIGLESAMSYYRFIPEAVYQITSITTRKTKLFKTSLANFSYRTIKESIFWGYNLKYDNHGGYFISDPEKTIIDYFYLNSYQSDINSINELRLNKERCRELLNAKILTKYLKLFNNKRLTSAIKLLKDLSYVKP